MQNFFLAVLTLWIFLFNFVFGREPIIDANSKDTIIQKINKLTSGGLIHLTFKSKIDHSIQPMLTKIPSGYTKAKSWPLLVVLHGLGDGPIVVPSIDSMVQIGPFGRGDMWYQGIGEQDVFECIELARQFFNIDSNRIYLCGFSMGGAGTFDLGLKYPDTWAACVPVCGKISNHDFITNAGNLPFWINTGGEDRVVPAKNSKRAYKKAIELGLKHWKYTEYEGMGHSFWIDWPKIEKWLLAQKKIKRPSSISFTSKKPAKAYWLEIIKQCNIEKPARIDVGTTSQTIKIKISNIADYKLYLTDAPVILSQKLTIIENEKLIFREKLSPDGIFHRKLDAKNINIVRTE